MNCVQCNQELKGEWDSGKSVEIMRTVTQEDLDKNVYIFKMYKVGDLIRCGRENEKVPYCLNKECRNYKLLQIGE